jgi:hypothetical protein
MGIQAEDVGVVATTIQTGHCHTGPHDSVRISVSTGSSLPNVTDGRIQVPINVQASIIKWRREVIHLHEEKMFIRLQAKEEGESKVWICHTGTTNDMSGSERHSLIWINLF